MLSDLLGLTIDKGNLNKKSPSPVTSSLKKTATNYLAIGRMAEDLKLIRLNFSRWLAMEGVKVRGTPDMHMLKEDELSKKFGVMREKYFRSKVKLASSDGTSSNKGWAKNLLEKYVGYKIGRKIERNLAAAVLKKYKKLTWIRKLVRLKKKIKVFVNKILSKINLKKMLGEWINQNYKKFVEPLAKHLASKLGFTTGLKAGLKGAATVALKGFVRVIPFIGWAIVIFEGLYAAWNSPPNSDIFKEFILGALDSLTLGLVGKENISAIYDKISEWHSTLFAKMFDAIDRSFKFIEEKMTSFVDFIIEKGKSLFTIETRPADFESSFEKWNKQRLQEESKMFEEYSDYFDKMEKAISDKKIKIGKLQFEIASLEYSISAMVKGPEDARLQEAKIQKAKEEAEKTRLEEEVKKTREGGGPVEEKKKKSETPTSTKPSAAPITPPPTKPSAAPVTPPSTKPSTVTPTSSGAGGTEQAILDEIAKHESESSGGYNAMNQGTKGKIVSGPSEKIIGKKLTDMTVGELMEKAANDNDSAEKRKKEGLIFAAGRYQIIPKTLKELVKKGAASVQDKFDAKTQDKLCIALLELRGLSKYKQGKISAKEFQNNLAKEWASLPTTEGVSYYHKPGQNVAGKGADQGLKNAIATITPATDTKLASAEPKPTTTASSGKFLKDESKQVAQAQREQMKPKDVNVAKVDKTNNVKQTNYQNVAMGKDTNPAETVTNRAA